MFGTETLNISKVHLHRCIRPVLIKLQLHHQRYVIVVEQSSFAEPAPVAPFELFLWERQNSLKWRNTDDVLVYFYLILFINILHASTRHHFSLFCGATPFSGVDVFVTSPCNQVEILLRVIIKYLKLMFTCPILTWIYCGLSHISVDQN